MRNGNAFNGIAWGLLFSIPLWLMIIWMARAICKH